MPIMQPRPSWDDGHDEDVNALLEPDADDWDDLGIPRSSAKAEPNPARSVRISDGRWEALALMGRIHGRSAAGQMRYLIDEAMARHGLTIEEDELFLPGEETVSGTGNTSSMKRR